jgi:hypothetical protein
MKKKAQVSQSQIKFHQKIKKVDLEKILQKNVKVIQIKTLQNYFPLVTVKTRTQMKNLLEHLHHQNIIIKLNIIIIK